MNDSVAGINVLKNEPGEPHIGDLYYFGAGGRISRKQKRKSRKNKKINKKYPKNTQKKRRRVIRRKTRRHRLL